MRRFSLLIVTPWKEEWDGRVFRFPEVKYLSRALKESFDYDVIGLKERPPRGDYDVVFVQSEIAYKRGRDIYRSVGAKRFVVAIYGVFEYFPLRKVFTPLHRWRYRRFDRAFKGGADVFLITDDGSKGEVLAQRYGQPFILLPVPKPPWRRVDRLEARERLGLPRNGPVAGFAGALNKLKGAHLLREIYERARGVYKLAVIGYGPMLGEFERWAKRTGGRVFVLPPFPHEDMAVFYSAVDFVLAPYLYGNKTAVVVEAMSLGLPVVVFQAHSSDEIIRHGWNGFIARNFDTDEFAHYTVRLATDPILRESVGESAKISSEGFPTWDHRVSTILQALLPA